jgi:hypothetical protein
MLHLYVHVAHFSAQINCKQTTLEMSAIEELNHKPFTYLLFTSGLPDGLFSKQKSKLG